MNEQLATTALRYIAAVAGLAALYYVSARFGLTWATVQENVTAIWPPSGISLAILLYFGRRLWPGVFLGSLLANFATQASFASAAAIASGDTLEGVAAAAILTSLGFDKRLGRLSDVLRLVLVGVLGAPVLAATNGALQVCIADLAPWSDFPAIWIAWWLGDGLSIMVLTPFLLAWMPMAATWPSWQRLAEGAVIGVLVIATNVFAFGFSGGAVRPVLAYAVFPVVLFAAMRFGLRGATATVLLSTVLPIWAASHNPDLFVLTGSAEGLMILQVFVGVLALSTLALSAALAERESALTALRQSEAEASRSRARLTDAVQSIRDHFILYDADDRLVLINDVARNWHPEFAAAAVPGVRFIDLLRVGAKTGLMGRPGADVEDIVQERLGLHRKSYGTVLERQIGDRWLQIREFPTSDGGIVILRTDITELKQTVAALQDSEQRASRAHALLVDAIESLDDGLLLWDAQDRLVLFNTAIKRMIPEKSSFLVPRIGFAELIEKRVRAGLVAGATGREDEIIRDRVAQHQKANGESIEQHFANGTWTRLRERRTREGGVVAIRTDITTLKQREAELIAARSDAISASRAKSDFLAMMSHELRTPLNVVIGFAEILKTQSDRLETPKIVSYADNVHEAARHLLDLLNDLLDLSKAEAGKMELQTGPVDVADVIDRSVRMIKERATQRRITLDERVERSLPIIEADERKLMQIFLNLLSNAVKFTREGGQVAIAARRDGPDRLIIQIIDNGIGIAPENIEKALTAFGQVHNLLTREQSGTGLGLPLAKRLTELHGATLDLESAVGVGTTVTLRFPVTRADSIAVA